MPEHEKDNMAVLKEHELLMNVDLINSIPELREYAEKIRSKFRAKGLELDKHMSLKTMKKIPVEVGIEIPIPDPGGVCKNDCTAWSGGHDHKCGVGCTDCVGPCVDCVSWAGNQGPSCGVCSDCVKWT